MQRLRNLRDRAAEPRRLLEQVVQCAGGPAITRQLLRNVPAPEVWITTRIKARAEFRACLDALEPLRVEAQATLDRTAAELTTLRQQPPLLPGSADYENLARQVRQLETSHARAEDLLRAIAAPGHAERVCEVLDPTFLDRVDQGARFAANYLLEKEAMNTCDRLATRVKDAAHHVRLIVQEIDQVEQMAEKAAQFADGPVSTVRAVLPHIDAWRTVAAGEAPHVGESIDADAAQPGASSGERARRGHRTPKGTTSAAPEAARA